MKYIIHILHIFYDTCFLTSQSPCLLLKVCICHFYVPQGAAEDPSKRLEVSETELQLMLEVDAEVAANERPAEGSCQLLEERDSEGETHQRQRLARKNGKGNGFDTCRT